MHGVTLFPLALGLDCLSFMGTLCESAVNVTDVLINPSSESTVYRNPKGAPAKQQDVSALYKKQPHGGGVPRQHPLIMKNKFL